MPVPLYQAKAEFFRTLGHPVRIRVLELLQDGPRPVRELLEQIDIEASSLSRQLAVLRRTQLVTVTREGDAVVYELGTPDVAELLRAARRILTDLLADQGELLVQLRNGAAVEPGGVHR
ncbi:metalloregulator ArsR/SmtB family transcription factor [Kitasatospora sp. GP82]|uniref:ArsR/SmtB family transcription factor n=1 Tax=Kitasatospora sp. GP82 TaxID=3035089 RepID=UPI0024733240|nr:metalloregulator ArsR/SmtB family transcription factor [Kitasatospora sp. GP82]MDH6128147.1 DNA-binding transcriptional ArsR family regulator [Kitasatospora sp. GP82]